jgi:hypothetical protein
MDEKILGKLSYRKNIGTNAILNVKYTVEGHRGIFK